MKVVYNLLNERNAKVAAQIMRVVCYIVIAFFVLCLILSLMGRQSFRLQTNTAFYAKAIYAEDNHNPPSRSFTVSTYDDILVQTGVDDQITFMTHIVLSVMYVIHIVPLIIAFWFLSCVFSNVGKGQIFTEQNGRYLLYYGIIQLFVSLFVPLIKRFVCGLSNLISSNTITISTDSNWLNALIPSIAFIVAAYVIHYGIHLQDEVDHTL